MSLIILFSYSSHLVRTMICGGVSGSSQSYGKHLQITAALERRTATPPFKSEYQVRLTAHSDRRPQNPQVDARIGHSRQSDRIPSIVS
jgi:hypothetical protein